MIISPDLITAIAKPLSGSTSREGAGRVERRLDSSTYVISLGSSRMTVRVTDGSLGVGQRVNVTARDDTLVIERLGPLPSAAHAGSDAYLRGGAATARDLRARLDAIIAEISAPGAGSDAFRRAGVLLNAMAADLSPVDPKLTEAAKQALGRAAAAPPEAILTAENRRDAALLLQHLRNAVAEAETAGVPGRTVTIPRPLPEGLYTFSSVEEALRFLEAGAAANGSLASDLEAALAEDGVIVIRTAASGAAETAATLLRQSDLLRELESLASRFTSRAFQSMGAGVFERLLLDRGSLNFDLLRLLDAFASGLQLPAASSRAGSREAQEAALLQWLHAAFDSPSISGPLASLLPAFSASSLVNAMEEFSASAAGIGGLPQQMPKAESFGLTMQTLGETADRSLLFDHLFKRLGLDFEHTIATSGSTDKTGLKPLLLNFSHLLGGQTSAAAGANVPALQTGPAADPGRQLRAALVDFEQACLLSIEKSLASAAARPENAGTEAQAALAQLRRDVADLLRSQVADLGRLIDRLQSEIRELMRNTAALRGNEGTGSRPALSADTANAFMHDARSRIDSLLQQMTAAVNSSMKNPTQNSAGDQAPAASREAAFSPVKPLPALQGPLEKAFSAALFQKIEDFRTLFPRLAETLLRHAVQEGIRRGPEGAAAAQQQLQAAPDETDPGAALRQALRQNLDTLLTRFESIQLLARQVPTAAGDQQIVALPIKVGEEWTEMHVRFVRRRSKGRAGQQGHYSVYLNVAPSLLGAISCRLEYERKKSLAVSVEFESRETREWFQEHKNDVRKALLSLGLPSPQLEFHVERKGRTGKDSTTAAASPSSTIDLKV